MFFNRIGKVNWCLVGAVWLWLISSAGASAETDPGPVPLLAKVYRSSIDLSNWWVSEKLDGVRAIWDGKALHFRSGRPIYAPVWFTQDFPPQPLDGELWMGRGTFERLSGVVRKQNPVEREWRAVRYKVFELPEAEGTFTQRIQQMEQWVQQAAPPWLQLVEQRRVESEAALMQWLDEVTTQGGEGLMLHYADSLYHGGRSNDLLKLKSWRDAEATVVEILPGKGKNKGRMGALLVESREGVRFRIGSGFSEEERQNPPQRGALVTFKYTGTTRRGLPRFPSFMRIREEY
ncbi:MAG: DNA ligase [Gammaproteobacteria bacterium]|jgi:DNA ligase 1|nr:DNA ligase [Gammaproteobacteria bacterium]